MANPNTAVFPTSLATDTTLPVNTDDAFSTLTSNISNSVNSIPFTSPTTFTLPCLIAIENEIVLALGPVSGSNITNCSRGFAGTTPASHNSGVEGFAYIFSYYLNQISAEIKAIETALGTSLSNVVKVGGTAGGNLSGTFPNPTVATVGGATAASVATAASEAHAQNTDIGTTSTTFQVGTSGPKIKNSGSVLQVRNAADSDYADLIVKNLTIEGTVTEVSSTEINIGDQYLNLNSNVSGSPTSNAGLIVTRGSSTNADLIWNESTGKWQAGLFGAEHDLIISGYTAGGDITGTYPNPTLAIVNTNVGVFGDGTHVAVVTADAKGRITAISSTPITGAAPSGAAGGDLSGTFPDPTVAEVGGVAAATIAAAITVVGAATSTNTVSTLVERDTNGDFAGRNITATSFLGPATSATSATKSARLITTGLGAPTITLGAGAGSGSGLGFTQSGTDICGQIVLTTGATTPTIAAILTLTFGAALSTSPYIFIEAINANASALGGTNKPLLASVGTTSFQLTAQTALAASTVYTWNYLVIQ